MEELRSLEDLLELQGLDSEIDRLLDRRSGLPLLDEYKSAHQGLLALEKDLVTARDREHQLSLAEDKAEGEMGLDEEKLKREETRLYAGGLSARDATHMRDEVEMLRSRISQREEEALELLEQQQQAAAEVTRLEEETATQTELKDRLEGEIQSEWKAIDANVARLEAKKAEVVRLIAPELLELYEEIRPVKEGVAAAAFVDGTCAGCHLRLSAAEQVQVLKADPPRCIHCRRILVPG